MFKKRAPIDIEPESLEASIAALNKIEPAHPAPQAPAPNAENDWTDHERDTQPNSLHFRHVEPPEDPNKLWKYLGMGAGALVLVGALGLVLAVKFLPSVRVQVMNGTRSLAKVTADSSVATYTRPALSKFYKYIKGMHLSAKTLDKSPASPKDICSDRIRIALDQKLKGTLATPEVYVLQSCMMFQDAPQVAMRYSEAPTAGKGEGTKRPKTALKLDWKSLPQILLMQEAERRLHAIENKLPGKHLKCKKWASTPVCMLRFADEARQAYASKWEDAYAVLEAKIASQSPTVQAWLHMLAGFHAIKSQKPAEAYLLKAAEALGTTFDPFLEREIFRARVLSAYRTGPSNLMNEVWERRPFERFAEDEAAFMDVELIHSMHENPASAKEHLELFFRNPQSYQRFRYDLFWIRFVIEQAILAEMSSSAQIWLDKLLQEAASTGTRDTNEGIVMLRIRLLLANGKAFETLEYMTKVERTVVRSMQWHHLRGLALLQAFDKRDKHLLAAKELQSAANLGPQSASPFVLIVAFIDLQDLPRAEATLAYWNRMKGNDEFLLTLAQGLIQYAKGDLEGARKLWTTHMQKYPELEFWKKLSRNLGEDPSYFQKDLFKRLLPMMGQDSPIGALSLFR